MMKNALIAAAVIAVLIGLVVVSLYLRGDGQGKTHADAGAEKLVVHGTPRVLPDFVFTRADGGETRLAAWRGKVVVLNFWATWCAPCREEMPQLDALQARFSDAPVIVLALALDRDGAERADAFLDDLGIAHLTRGYDPSYESARMSGIFGLPTTLIIGRDGREVARLAGAAEWDSIPFRDFVRRLLAEEK